MSKLSKGRLCVTGIAAIRSNPPTSSWTIAVGRVETEAVEYLHLHK